LPRIRRWHDDRRLGAPEGWLDGARRRGQIR